MIASLIEQNKPAVGKIKLLPKVSAYLSNRRLHEPLLDSLLLQRVRDWLRPLPDGSLPNLQLRSQLYRLLSQMPIDTDHLQESEGLGLELMALWRSPKETVENRKFLKRLLEKWIRAIFKSSIDYKRLHFVEKKSALRSSEIVKRRDQQNKLYSQNFIKSQRMPREFLPILTHILTIQIIINHILINCNLLIDK